MDIDLEKRVREAIEQLQPLANSEIKFQQQDPIAKMMFVALMNEVQDIQDGIRHTEERIAERFYADFIPREKVGAMPSIALTKADFKLKNEVCMYSIGAGAQFSYKIVGSKQPINFIPIFSTTLFRHNSLYTIKANADAPNELWVGIPLLTETESLKNMSIFIKGTCGVCPEHIYAGNEGHEVEFATMNRMEDMEMVEPFDAQQASGQFFSFIESWKNSLLNMSDAALLYIVDETQDRDLFKLHTYPKDFQKWLESEDLDRFATRNLWLKLVFPENYSIPSTCEIQLNVFPVVNIDVCSVKLTQAAPIAKLQEKEDAFFLRVLETSSNACKQGFGMTSGEIVVRDFDAECYHNGDLYRDIQKLYHRFSTDFHAFVEYNAIKDGEKLRRLRDLIVTLGRGVQGDNKKHLFDSGTYVMKSIDKQVSAVSVRYITTQGYRGNLPQTNELLEAKVPMPPLEPKFKIVMGAVGGTDKASADECYEQLRYFALTNDRLYTRMDVEAFLRKEIMAEFGKTEFNRIFIKTCIGGTGGEKALQRGLYIDIEFKDTKNYDRAVKGNYDTLLRQRIENKSCIAMPIIVSLKNIES